MSGHLDGPPPGPPDPPYIPGDLGAPSAEEFARRRASSEPRPENPMSDKRPTIEVHAEVPTPDAVRTFYEVPDAVASQIGVLDHKASFVENLVSLLAGKAYAVEAVNVAAIHHVDKMRDLRDQHNSETRKDCESGCDTHRTCREDRGPCTHGLTAGRGTAERCLECGEAVGEPRPENPYRDPDNPSQARAMKAWDKGFAAGRAAFDAVVAERDEAVKKLGIAIDVTHEFEDEKIALADRLAKWERGEWPSTEAQHGVLLDQIKELAAERDAAIAALREIAGDYGCHMREPADPSQPPRETPACREQYPDDRSYWCDPCIASAAVSGSSEPRKETT